MAEFEDDDSHAEVTDDDDDFEVRSWHSTAYTQIVHGERERKEEDANSIFKFATTFRRLSFCVLFWTNLLWLLLTIALALGGFDPINDDNLGEVGLAIPDEEYQMRANGYQQAKDEADLTLTVGKCAREDPVDPITLILMKGRFDRENRGNALSKSGLETLRSRENRVLSEDGWEARCARIYVDSYPTCRLDQGTPVPVFGSPNETYRLSDTNGCRRPYSPVLVFEKYGDPNFEDIRGTVDKIYNAQVDWQAFVDMLHKDFTKENLRSKILISDIYAGTPRREVSEYISEEDAKLIEAGFAISWYSDKDEEREFDHLNHWIEDNLGNWLEDQFRKTPYRTLYTYADYNPVDERVAGDLMLLAISILFIICYLWYYTGSAFITFCGIFQILMAFFGANLLYRYCWPTADGLGYNYFTLFCALSLFIIMGIGADDLFVYWDTWLGSATHSYKTVAHRMSHVYSHAAAAMAVTSGTTVLAFLSNLSSPFIGIQTFGIFSALLVIVNYLAVITFFPVAVLIYDAYFDDKQYWCAPCLARCWALFFSGETTQEEEEEVVVKKKAASPPNATAAAMQDDESPTKTDDGEDTLEATAVSGEVELPRVQVTSSTTDEVEEDDDDDDEHLDYTSALPIWFRDRYAPFLIRRKFWVIGILVALWVVFLAFATMLEATPFKQYELLPQTENFHQSTFAIEKWRTKTSQPLFVHVLYGLDHRMPLSLHGVKPQNFVEGESGDPEWDDTFDLDAIDAQLQLHRTAEEFANNPRKGLKIDRSYGINPQLFGSTTGSLEDTPDRGAQSSVVTAYGVQSFIHALATWENASVIDDPRIGSYRKKSDFTSSCRPCFDSFVVTPNPYDPKNPDDDAGQNMFGYYDHNLNITASELTLNATANLNDNCNCYGYFPVATEVCLHETRASVPGTLFKCAEQDDGFAFQIANYLQAGNTTFDENWWTDYIFALSDSYGRYVRVALYDIQVMTVLSEEEKDFEAGLKMVKKWDDFMDDHNGDPNNPLKVMVHVPLAATWVTDSLLVPSGISNMILSLFLAWIVLVLSTGNWMTASIATVTIGMICTIVLGCIQILGWGLGAIESILIVIVVGFSVDYTVHLADSYMASRSVTREGKVMDALVHTGSSVLSGAISTIGASIPMFGAQIIFFQKFGAFVFITIALSLTFSIGFFSALLLVIGPLGKAGNVSNWYAGMVVSMHKHIHELEEEQRLVDENRRRNKVHAAMKPQLSTIQEEDDDVPPDDDDDIVSPSSDLHADL